jgi:DNA-directed RNA polymerase specialized sigma24 family protein
MSRQSGTQRGWQLTASALDRFLRTLDPDRERAAVAYEALRERTTGLFEWWGAPRAAELADETLDRAARKVEEGAVIAEGSLGAYVRGVARLVFYESTRDRTVQLPDAEIAVESSSDDAEPALACLDECLETLPANDRVLVLRYYDGGRRADARQRLADETGVSMTALRIRTHRLRRKLEQCVTSCLARA